MVKIASRPTTILDDPALLGSRVVTPAEAAAILNLGATKLYELLVEGKIRSYKDGRSRRVFLVSLLQYQNDLVAKGPRFDGLSPKARAKATAR
jgi:excisionase family DNA binding protein